MIDFLKYVKYSGAAISITLNPFHWAWIPNVRFQSNEIWDYSKTIVVSFLFLSVRLWLDDGKW